VSTQNKNGFLLRKISHGLPYSDTLRPALFRIVLLYSYRRRIPRA
jgi:hypothetical protein